MEEQLSNSIEAISQEDWERTPASVKRLVEEIAKRARQFEEQQARIATWASTVARAGEPDIGKLIPTPLTRSAERI